MCNLLEQWITSHPHDFTAPGALPVYSDIVRLVTGYQSASSYNLKFQEFEIRIPFLDKNMRVWDLFQHRQGESEAFIKARNEDIPSHTETHIRKLGLSYFQSPLTCFTAYQVQAEPRCSLKQLKEIASRINILSSAWIAEEITRMQVELFLRIEVGLSPCKRTSLKIRQPRDWLYHVLVSLKVRGPADSVTRFSSLDNHLGQW
jgi:hypothetical protein